MHARATLDAGEAHWLRSAEALQIWRPLGMVSALDYLERVLGHGPASHRIDCGSPVRSERCRTGTADHFQVRRGAKLSPIASVDAHVGAVANSTPTWA